MNAAGVIAYYVMDEDRPLTAESAGTATFYLYSLGGIGEKTTAWNFSLPDGTNTPRQLSDVSGEITLSARYTPWGAIRSIPIAPATLRQAQGKLSPSVILVEYWMPLPDCFTLAMDSIMIRPRAGS